MINITGKNGEGSGLIAAKAIESILKEDARAVVILLDDTSEFMPLCHDLNGFVVNLGFGYKQLEERYIEESNLYVIRCDGPIEYYLKDIKKFGNMISSKRVYVIYKSTNIEEAGLIAREYDKID